jgi:tol-pal system protein YbgF
LQNENQQLKASSQAQYLDVDSRLQRIEGGGSGTRPPAAGGTAIPATPTSRPPAARPPVRPTATGAAMPEAADEQAAYTAAFDSLKQGDYVASARGFKAYVDSYPQGALAPNAWYWLGESYYVTQNYPLALQSFESLLSQFPGSTKAPDALLKKGYSQIEMGEAGAGRQTLNQLINDYPGTDASRLADGRLRALGVQ